MSFKEFDSIAWAGTTVTINLTNGDSEIITLQDDKWLQLIVHPTKKEIQIDSDASPQPDDVYVKVKSSVSKIKAGEWSRQGDKFWSTVFIGNTDDRPGVSGNMFNMQTTQGVFLKVTKDADGNVTHFEAKLEMKVP